MKIDRTQDHAGLDSRKLQGYVRYRFKLFKVLLKKFVAPFSLKKSIFDLSFLPFSSHFYTNLLSIFSAYRIHFSKKLYHPWELKAICKDFKSYRNYSSYHLAKKSNLAYGANQFSLRGDQILDQTVCQLQLQILLVVSVRSTFVGYRFLDYYSCFCSWNIYLA